MDMVGRPFLYWGSKVGLDEVRGVNQRLCLCCRQRAAVNKSLHLIAERAELIDGRVRLAGNELGADCLELGNQRISLVCVRLPPANNAST